jgi:hypothetical protein
MAEANGRRPSRARYALQWRPHFLAALALSHPPRLAARAAHISPMTAYSHRRNDPEFAEQWEEAESHATDLIVGRAFQRALEGDCEPIFYKGKVVAMSENLIPTFRSRSCAPSGPTSSRRLEHR